MLMVCRNAQPFDYTAGAAGVQRCGEAFIPVPPDPGAAAAAAEREQAQAAEIADLQAELREARNDVAAARRQHVKDLAAAAAQAEAQATQVAEHAAGEAKCGAALLQATEAEASAPAAFAHGTTGC